MRDIERILPEQLPGTWIVRARPTPNDSQVDLVIDLGSQPDRTITLAMEIKRSIDPRRIPDVARQLTTLADREIPGATPVVAAGYLSPRSRQLLEDLNVGYIDTTGNIRINAGNLFVRTQGADKDPWPKDDNLQSLRGRGAARALRAIIDTAPPFGVRELASNTANSPATVSRVLELLEVEGLISREPRGPVLTVDWQDSIRRWAEDYDQTTTNTATMCLAPRGIANFDQMLETSKLAYAATGAFAAQRFNPVAPARMATIYVDDVAEAVEHFDLRETDAGANVMLLEPFDPVVFDRTIQRDRLRCVAPSQLAADLLTGPGREPSQGEAILEWMKENLDAWKA